MDLTEEQQKQALELSKTEWRFSSIARKLRVTTCDVSKFLKRNGFTRLTTEQKKLALELVKVEGWSFTSVAERLSVPTCRLTKFLKEEGFTRPQGRRPCIISPDRIVAAYNEGNTIKGVSIMLGQPYTKVRLFLKHAGLIRPKGYSNSSRKHDRNRAIAELYDMGNSSMSSLAEIYGVSKQRVNQIITDEIARRD